MRTAFDMAREAAEERNGRRHDPRYTLGSGPVEVYCDNDKSYRIVDACERTIALVKCDRTDHDDNQRGFAIAIAIMAALNAAQEEA